LERQAVLEKKIDAFVVQERLVGSFGCVRLAPHFAQDDRVQDDSR
jgi:hypothetical protein